MAGIGFVGLGDMGSRMVPHLLDAKYRVAVFDVIEDRLPYEAVRTDADPDGVVAEFLHTTYAAAADLGEWHRGNLEIDPARWDHHRQPRDRSR